MSTTIGDTLPSLFYLSLLFILPPPLPSSLFALVRWQFVLWLIFVSLVFFVLYPLASRKREPGPALGTLALDGIVRCSFCIEHTI